MTGSGAGGRRRRGIAAVTLALAALVPVACSGSSKKSDAPGGTTASGSPTERGGTLRAGVVGVDGFDPAEALPTSQSSLVAADLLFDGLTVIDPATNAAAPALATSWEMNDAVDRFTFTLREGATFSDGSPVTPADVKFTLERLARRGTASIPGMRLDMVQGYDALLDGSANELTGVTTPDERTVVITTTGSFAALPELLASPLYGVVPKAAVEADAEAFDRNPVGSGPFRMDPVGADADPRSTTRTLASVSADAVELDKVELRPFTDVAAAWAAYDTGELDWSPVAPADVSAASGGGATVLPLLAESFFAINTKAAPLDNETFRKAIVAAVDRDALARDALGGSPRLDGIVPQAVPGGVADACGDVCRFDTAKAKELVAQAFPDGNVPTVTLTVYDDPVQKKLADGVKAGLDAAGIPNEVQVKPFEEYRTFVVSGQQQLFSYGWVAVAPEAEFTLGPLFLSDSPDNVTGFAQPAFDLSLVSTRGYRDRAERLARYGDLERSVLATAPVVPIASVGSRAAVRGSVQGVAGRLDGTFDVTKVWVR